MEKNNNKKSNYFKDCNFIIKNHPNVFSKNIYFLIIGTFWLLVFINYISIVP